MRCFIGLPMPEQYQQGLRRLTATWRPKLHSKLSWTRPGNWHLTLKFLGEVPENTFSPLVQILRPPLGKRFVLQAQGGGFFPDPTRPRVLWVGVGRGDDACRSLAQEIARRCEAVGFPLEHRPFSSHLTIARIKQHKPDPWPQVLQSLHAITWPVAEMNRVVLWKSSLDNNGPIYTAMEKFPLL